MKLDWSVSDALDGASSLPARSECMAWAEAALRFAGRPPRAWELSVMIVDRAEMADLNQRFRGKSGPTNVLSFPYEPLPGVELPMLGDIVICAPVVAEEARERGGPEPDHWAHMLIHGVLHLCGHDHLEASQAAVMESLETRILASLGFPDPYDAGFRPTRKYDTRHE